MRVVAATERNAVVRPEDCRQERDGEIQASKSDEAVDDAGHRVGGAELLAKDLSDKVELPDCDESPVQGSRR